MALDFAQCTQAKTGPTTGSSGEVNCDIVRMVAFIIFQIAFAVTWKATNIKWAELRLKKEKKKKKN